MKPKGIKTIALLLAAITLVVGSVAGIAAAGAGDGGGDEEFEWNWDACYWWEALPISPHHQQQAREVGILIFDRYFGIDISAMSPQELEELWDMIGHENQEKALALFTQYATGKGFEIPGMPAPREEFIPPPDATYWWEFIDPERRDAAIATAKMKLPERVRSHWELADWKGVELPIPRREELCIPTLTIEEYEQILAPPSFPLGRVGIEDWYERFFPGTTIVAVFGRPRTYDNPDAWFDKLLKADNLMAPLIDLLFREFRIISQGVSGHGHITVALDCKLTLEEAKAIAAKIYALKAPKGEMAGIEDIPVVFVQGWERPVRLGTFKDPRDHLNTPPPLDQGFRPIPGGAQVAIRPVTLEKPVATVGFPVQDPILWWWKDEDITTTGHLAPVNTLLYQPVPPYQVGRIVDLGTLYADVARVGYP
ncbi:hypothetical protein M1O51_04485 [Dehalococcoidia bacterium]|nr:hypothetical protein [Dehalococcoidia bacterium]